MTVGKKPLDLAGKRFGNLLAISRSTKRAPNESYMWNCVCDCGTKLQVNAGSLSRGDRTSCGCVAKQNRRDGQAKKMKAIYGTYMPCSDPWYVRAAAIKQRCRINNIPFGFESIVDLALYLREISVKKCPVFGVKLVTGTKTMHRWSPSVDKIAPKKGYVRGNLQIVSYLANSMKRDATRKEMKQFAQWILKGESHATTH